MKTLMILIASLLLCSCASKPTWQNYQHYRGNCMVSNDGLVQVCN